MITPHDAEETMRSSLGRIYDTKIEFGAQPGPITAETFAYTTALGDALRQALDLLGVRS